MTHSRTVPLSSDHVSYKNESKPILPERCFCRERSFDSTRNKNWRIPPPTKQTKKIVKFEILYFLSRPCKNTNRRRQKFPKPAPKDLEEIDLCTTTEEKVASRGLEHPEFKGQKIVSEA